MSFRPRPIRVQCALSLLAALALAVLPARAVRAQSVEIEMEDDAELVVPAAPASERAPASPSTSSSAAASTDTAAASDSPPSTARTSTSADESASSTDASIDASTEAGPELTTARAPVASARDAELETLRAELAALRERLDTLARTSPTTPAAAEPTATEPEPTLDVAGALSRWGVSLTGYLQAQYEWSDLSEDQLQQGGIVLNRNRFSIRRGRIRLAGEWEHFAFEIELDGSTTQGPFVGLRRTTVSTLLRNPDPTLPPFVELSAGLTEIPFGREVRQGQRDWLFMERSLGSLSFFRGPLDVGIRAQGGVGVVRYDVAVMGGTPLDDRAGQGFAVDPTSAPDIAGRVGLEMDRHPDFELGGGLSFLWGTGFHPGQDAVKGRLEWRDLNESGTLDTGEVIAVPGRAATPSATFERWAANVDVYAGLRTPLGWTRVFAEATLASNLDRSLYVADPVATGYDVRHLSAYVALTQDIYDWGLVGFRYDYYDPNSDLVDQRRGLSVPVDASIHTLSPLLGVRLPPDIAPGFRARLTFQYDAILDAMGRDATGVPTDLRNDQLTVRLQGEFR